MRVGVLAVGVVDGAELGERLVDALHLVEEDAAEPEAQRDAELAIAARVGLLRSTCW